MSAKQRAKPAGAEGQADVIDGAEARAGDARATIAATTTAATTSGSPAANSTRRLRCFRLTPTPFVSPTSPASDGAFRYSEMTRRRPPVSPIPRAESRRIGAEDSSPTFGG